MQLTDGVCSRWFVVERGLRQECVLALFLFNIFFAVVINVAYTRFKADKNIMGAFVHIEKQMGAGGGGKQSLESHPWRHCCGVCFTLTMPKSSRNRPSRPGR